MTPPAEPLVEELTPAPEPWDVARRLAGRPHLLFLDSAAADPPLGRYSYVAADPFAVLTGFESGPPPRWMSVWQDTHFLNLPEPDPFTALAARLARFPARTVPGLPPFQGGAAGVFGYGLSRCLEELPPRHTDEFGLPDLVVGFYDWVIAFDHAAGRAWVVSTGWPQTDPARRRERAARRLGIVRRRLKAPAPAVRPPWRMPLPRDWLSPQYPLPGWPGVTSNFDRDGYLAAVRRAVEYTHAGDCFQVNVSQRLLTPTAEPPLELYGRLRRVNPAPFAGYFDASKRFAVASASPERFLTVDAAGEVETRPIKGTRPRGATPDADRAQIAELLASPKDRAENVMIVDLLRNDLGKVCAYGSVRVEALCRVETYRHVHHLVSEVRGRLRPGMTAVDLLRAAFPGGSVTGAPKVRAMQIIAELEPTARGPYCGSLGWLGFDGAMDTSILIRTFTVGRGWAQFPVGGGIVADSDPAREYEETLHKAEGLLRALRFQ
jgi:para-aminobenzoate synthetase component 1